MAFEVVCFGADGSQQLFKSAVDAAKVCGLAPKTLRKKLKEGDWQHDGRRWSLRVSTNTPPASAPAASAPSGSAPAATAPAATAPAASTPTSEVDAPAEEAPLAAAVPDANAAPGSGEAGAHPLDNVSAVTEANDPELAAASMFAALRTPEGRVVTEVRKDGYFNATKMAQSVGKGLWGYIQNQGTIEFLKELKASLEKDPSSERSHRNQGHLLREGSAPYPGAPGDLQERSPTTSRSHLLREGSPGALLVQVISDGPNRQRGTWVHPRVAIHLAQWCSPKFAVKVVDLVFRYTLGKVTTEESQAAARIAQQYVQPAREEDDEDIRAAKKKKVLHELEMEMTRSEMEHRLNSVKHEVAIVAELKGLADNSPLARIQIGLASSNIVSKYTSNSAAPGLPSTGGASGPRDATLRVSIQELARNMNLSAAQMTSRHLSQLGTTFAKKFMAIPGNFEIEWNETKNKFVESVGWNPKQEIGTYDEFPGDKDFDKARIRYAVLFGVGEAGTSGVNNSWTYPVAYRNDIVDVIRNCKCLDCLARKKS